ncbi:MAG: hypothetical protein Q4D42_03280 [Eubacteriales bacterium]|nr:hypothetical protein [Eubacteriales bacterium]
MKEIVKILGMMRIYGRREIGIEWENIWEIIEKAKKSRKQQQFFDIKMARKSEIKRKNKQDKDRLHK